jgi:hypothetical protein
MGHSTLLDLIASISIFGLLFLIILRLNAGASESSSAYFANYMLQRNMLTLTVMLEQDLKRVGLNNGDMNGGILVADSNRFCFMTDLDVNDGNPTDVVEYRTGPVAELNTTPNPNDRYLYRSVNGVVSKMNLGLTQFSILYYDIVDPTNKLTFPIVNLGNIGPVDISIKLESPYKMVKQEYMNDTSQYEMLWRQIRTVSRNTVLQTSIRPR